MTGLAKTLGYPVNIRHLHVWRVLTHCVGYARNGSRRPIGWRNHFAASPGWASDICCRYAVEWGWMTEGQREGKHSSYNYYHATRLGLDLVSRHTNRSIEVE